ncbi:MAG: thiol:disulfide interchange protein DsbA/DsbL [Caldimonas sp.]
MAIDRRDFSIALATAGLAGTLAALARAQASTPVEGVNYVRLEQPVPAGARGRIEVLEFFWYECPYCNAFEPALEAWAQKQSADIALRRVPVWFQEVPFAAQQRLYYAIDSLGLAPTLHRRAFATIHNERFRLRTPEDMAAFALKNGVDPVKFMSTYASAEVTALAVQARRLAEAYKIDAVPAMGIQGRYYTNGNLANAGQPPKGPVVGDERLLAVVDTLIGRVRKPR